MKKAKEFCLKWFECTQWKNAQLINVLPFPDFRSFLMHLFSVPQAESLNCPASTNSKKQLRIFEKNCDNLSSAPACFVIFLTRVVGRCRCPNGFNVKVHLSKGIAAESLRPFNIIFKTYMNCKNSKPSNCTKLYKL